MAVVPTVDQVEHPEAWGYDGSLANILLRLAVSEETPLEEATAEARPPRIDTAESAEDVRDETGDRYSRSILNGGAGLDLLHVPDRPDDAQVRFWDSKGVDVFRPAVGRPYSAQLAHDVIQQQAVAAANLQVWAIDGTVMYRDGTDLVQYPSTVLHTSGSTITSSVRAMGNSFYYVNSLGLRRVDPPWTTTNAVSSTVYDEIWTAKDRVIAKVNNTVIEVVDGTSDITLLTLPDADYVTAVADVGPAIMVLTTTGTAYLFTIDSTDATLQLSGQTNFSKQEIPVAAAESQNVVGIVTTAPNEAGGRITRFYVATVTTRTNQTELENIRLVFTLGDRDTTEDLTPYFAHGTRDSLYLVAKEEGLSEATVWRYYLPTGGYARALVLETALTIDSMVQVDDRAYFAVPTDGIWKEQDTYVASGYVIGPLVDHFTADEKQWVLAQLNALELPTGTQLILYATTDQALMHSPNDAAWVQVAILRAGQSASEGVIVGMRGRYNAMKIVWQSDAARNATPEFYSASIRSLPKPNRDVIYLVPINISDQVEAPNRIPYTIPGRGDLVSDAIRQLEGQQVPLVLFNHDVDMLGVFEQLRVTTITDIKRGSPTQVMYIRIRGQRRTAGLTSTATSGASLGQDTLGIAILGIGEVNT